MVLILGLRADFYGRAAREPSLVPVLQHRQVVVGPMTVDELRRAIIEPARVSGCEVDEELVDQRSSARPSRSGQHTPGELPLLSHALLETWRGSRRGRLTVAEYAATGGIAGAVQQTAERVYGELSAEEQALARRVFLRVVNVEDDGFVTRRRVHRKELPRGAETLSEDCLQQVLDRFVSHRLLTLNAETVEVSHDALLVAWPRLRNWIEADRAGLLVHRQLGEAALLWINGGQDPAALLGAPGSREPRAGRRQGTTARTSTTSSAPS